MKVEEAVQRLLRKVETPGVQSDHRATYAKLRALDETAEVIKEKGSRPECEQARTHIEKACYTLLQQGCSVGIARSITAVLFNMWCWLDNDALSAGHSKLLEMVQGKAKDTGKYPLVLAGACQVLQAAYKALVDRGLGGGGTLGWGFLEALSTALPNLEKLPDWSSRCAALSALCACCEICMQGSGPPGQPLKEDSKTVKQLVRGAKDKDAAVRREAYRAMGAAGSCCTASGAAYDTLLVAVFKGLEDKAAPARSAAADAVSELLHVAFEQHAAKEGDAASSAAASQSLTGSFSLPQVRKRRAVGGIPQTLNALRDAFHASPSPQSREAAAAAATRFLNLCGPQACGSPKALLTLLLTFLPSKAIPEPEHLHCARAVASVMSGFAGGCAHEDARIAFTKEVAARLAVKPADRDRLDGAAFACLLALPDLFMQLGPDVLAPLQEGFVKALLACGSQCGTTRQRVECAKAFGTLGKLLPGQVPTLCHLLVSILIHHSGNALCAVGTPCDHEAIRCMMAAGTALLSIFPPDASRPDPSIHLQLTELCSVAFPGPPFDAQVDVTKKPSKGATVPIDPQAKLELAFLMESCLACCGGFVGITAALPKLTRTVADVLQGKEVPQTAKESIGAFRSRGSALLALVSVLRFAKATGKDMTLLANLVDESLLAALEDTFDLMYHKNVNWNDERAELLLCKTRTLAFEAVILLPQLPKVNTLYMVAMKACMGTIAALSVAQVSATLLPGLLNAALPPHQKQQKGFTAEVLQPIDQPDTEATLPSEICNWSRLVRVRGISREGPLVWEKWTMPWMTELLNESIRCLGIIFARQSKANKRNVMERLKQNLMASLEKSKGGGKATEKERPTQLNTVACALAALLQAAGHSSCRDVLWSGDTDLHQVAEDAVSLGKAVFPSSCPYTRTAGAEIAGLATALGGRLSDSVDAYLPTVLTKASGPEAAALASCIGALHAHDPTIDKKKGRADVLSLSLSYLQKLLRCDDAGRKGEEVAEPVAPYVLAALGRVVGSAGSGIGPYADSAGCIAVEKIVSGHPASEASVGGMDVEAATLAAAAAAIENGFISPEVPLAPPLEAAAKAVVLQGTVHPHPLPRREAVRAAAAGAMAMPLLHDAIGELSGAECGAKTTAVLCKLLREACRSDPAAAAECVGPHIFLKLVDTLGGQLAGELETSVLEAAEAVVRHAVGLLDADEAMASLGSRRLSEWTERCTEVLSVCRMVDPAPPDPDDEDAEQLSVTDRTATLRVATKTAAARLLCLLLSLLPSTKAPLLLPRLDPTLRGCLLACDDVASPSLRSWSISALTRAVQLFATVSDPKSAARDEHQTVLQPYLIQLASASQQGMDPANPPLVRARAAALCATLICSCVASAAATARAVQTLFARFNDHKDGFQARLGFTAAVCKVVSWAQTTQAAGVAAGVAQSVLKYVATTGPAEGGDGSLVSLADLQGRAVTALRELCTLEGIASGWVPADPAAELPHPDLLVEYKKACVPDLLRFAAGVRGEAELVSGCAAVLVEGAGDAEAAAVLRALEGFEGGAAHRALLRRKCYCGAPAVAEAALRCLASRPPPDAEEGTTAAAYALRLLPSDAAVWALEQLAAHGTPGVASLALRAVGTQLQKYSSGGGDGIGAPWLRLHSLAARGDGDVSVVRAVAGVLLRPPSPSPEEEHWWTHVGVSMSCLLRVSPHPPELPALEAEVCGGIDGAHVPPLAGLLAALRLDTSNDSYARFCVAAGAAAVTHAAAGDAAVMAGAKLLVAAVFSLKGGRRPVAAAVAALSTGASRSTTRAVPLGKGLLELAIRYQAEFKELLPELSSATSSLLRSQMDAARGSSTPATQNLQQSPK